MTKATNVVGVFRLTNPPPSLRFLALLLLILKRLQADEEEGNV